MAELRQQGRETWVGQIEKFHCRMPWGMSPELFVDSLQLDHWIFGDLWIDLIYVDAARK